MPRLVTSTPKLRSSGCVRTRARVLWYAGLTSVPPPVWFTRELLKPIEYDPPVGMSCEMPTSATVARLPVARNCEIVGDLVLCRSTSADASQS